MAFATVNGVELHTQVLGDGPPVTLVHGLLVGSMATWFFTTAKALSDSHRVVLYDLRGHGKSERAVHGYDPGTLAADLDGLLDYHAVARSALVGHSYGGLVALWYALAHPERVDKLVLVDIPLPAALMEGFHAREAPDPQELLASLPPQLQEAFAAGRRQARRLIEGLMFLLGQCSMVADVRAAGDIADERLAALRCPVLCIFGRDSGCRSAGERLARVIPGARLELLSCGHQVPLEASADMTELIGEFL